MQASKHNIFAAIKDSNQYFIANILTGEADVLSADEAVKYAAYTRGETNYEGAIFQSFIEKKYIIDPLEEQKLYNQKYLDFLDNRENDEIQIFLVPNYTCNFACTYCYQDEYAPAIGGFTDEKLEAFFNYISTAFAARKKYITVFGGEPLLSSPKQREVIAKIIEGSNALGLELCFVTNGYTLEGYIPVLAKGQIREIQITLDGLPETHNLRRPLKGGGNSFDAIVRGIDACLENKIQVNLRMVIDKENINDLPGLASFAIEKKWIKSPYFKTQIGRNYELHHCQSVPDKLFTRLSLYENLYAICKNNPHILEFYRPAFSVAKFLADTGGLPDPLFDSCPACKTEWAFDYTGHIYPCTATVGKHGESLGTFFPNVKLNTTRVNEWENRDVRAIPKCANCSLQLACGGGCGAVAQNANGSICSPDCRPVDDLMAMGFSLYQKVLL